jgi:putative transposase
VTSEQPRRGLAPFRRILFATDGGSGLVKALRARFGKKLVHQHCAIHKSRNLQRHLAKPYRKKTHWQLMTALEQASYADAIRMLLELEARLQTKTSRPVRVPRSGRRQIRSWMPSRNC